MFDTCWREERAFWVRQKFLVANRHFSWRAGLENLQAGLVHLLAGLGLRRAGLKLCCNVREIQVKLRARKEPVVLSSLKLFYCVEASTVYCLGVWDVLLTLALAGVCFLCLIRVGGKRGLLLWLETVQLGETVHFQLQNFSCLQLICLRKVEGLMDRKRYFVALATIVRLGRQERERRSQLIGCTGRKRCI